MSGFQSPRPATGTAATPPTDLLLRQAAETEIWTNAKRLAYLAAVQKAKEYSKIIHET